jgi:CHASE2 domain-containing sensor protein
MRSKLRHWRDTLKGKDRRFWTACVRHWVIAVALVIVGVYAGDWLGHHHYWIELRYWLHQKLTINFARPPLPHRTVVVLIGDEEYWKSDEEADPKRKLAGRVPVNRHYLANLIRTLNAAAPEVIAIDFDLSYPLPDGPRAGYANYDAEVEDFIRAVNESPANQVIVLPKTINGGEEGFVLEPDIYDDAGLGVRLDEGKVRKGYIILPDDMREVPLSLPIKGGEPLDSFAQAIARASEPQVVGRFDHGEALPYGNFIEPSMFPRFTARQVLEGGDKVKRELAHKIVIVGGEWHRYAHNRGDVVDTYSTPVGDIAGAFIHANYVEAILDSRISPPLGERIGKGVEITISLLIALLFFVNIRALWKILFVIFIPIVLILFSYFLWQNLGMFFDFFIPLVLLGGHVLVERWIGQRDKMRELQERVHHLELEASKQQPLPRQLTAATPAEVETV